MAWVLLLFIKKEMAIFGASFCIYGNHFLLYIRRYINHKNINSMEELKLKKWREDFSMEFEQLRIEFDAFFFNIFCLAFIFWMIPEALIHQQSL
jgi:hypothetical protein